MKFPHYLHNIITAMKLIDNNRDIISALIKIDNKTAESLLSQFMDNPEVLSVKHIKLGFSNWVGKLTLKTGESFCLKICVFPNRENKFKANYKFLQKFSKKQIPLPEIAYYDDSKKIFPYSFLIYKWIEGNVLADELEEGKISAEEAGKQLGSILSKIHSIEAPSISDPGHSKTFNNWEDYIETEFKKAFKFFDIYGEKTKNRVAIYYEKNKKNLNYKSKPRFIHKDFKAQNFIVGSNHDIIGSIDYENHITGDRMFDFGIINSYLFNRIPETKKTFLDEYTKTFDIPDNFDQLVNFYDFIVYAGHLKRSFELKEVDRFWSYENKFSDVLGEEVKVQHVPAWAV